MTILLTWKNRDVKIVTWAFEVVFFLVGSAVDELYREGEVAADDSGGIPKVVKRVKAKLKTLIPGVAC